MSDLLTFELCRKAILAWSLMYWATNISLCFCKSDIQTTFIFVTSSVLLLSPVTELTFWKRNGQVFQLFLLKTNSEISFNGCRLLSFLNQYVCPAFSPCKHLHNNGYTPYYIKCLLQATDSDNLAVSNLHTQSSCACNQRNFTTSFMNDLPRAIKITVLFIESTI